MRLTKIPAVFIICIGLAISSVAKAEATCSTPSGYYYEENLHLGMKNVFDRMNPRNLLYAYLSTQDNISEYRIKGKPKFFPDGEIILYIPTLYLQSTPKTSNIAYNPDLTSVEKLTMTTFPAFKRAILRNGFVPGYMMNDDFSNKFNQVFNTYYEPSFVSSENLGTIVNENFSFLTMGLTTHNINGTDVKFARAAGAIFQYRNSFLGMILMSKKLNNQYTQSDIQGIHTNFQNALANIEDCLLMPNGGATFDKEYKSTTYGAIVEAPQPTQEAPQPAQSESSEPVDYIEKLKEIKSLLDAGIINEEDFEKMKQKIIGNM
ncbi:SHOCT domain-containing protein [Candidatus Thioglobus sp.]|nr:SHOCT domain-containing protein [Candidatus Thioglobus sp.]